MARPVRHPRVLRRKPFVRKVTKFRRKRLRSKVNLSRTLGPIPQRLISKMKYAGQYSLTSTLGVPANQLWNLNSIFDPDRTGTGHQPYGHDTYATLFARYRVFGVSWRVNIVNDTSTANYNQGVTCVLIPFNGSVATPTPELAMEYPRAITKVLATGGKVTYSGHISLPRLNGVTSTQYKGDDRFQAQYGASPVELMTLQLYVMHPDSSVTVTVNATIVMVFHVESFDPLALGQS